MATDISDKNDTASKNQPGAESAPTSQVGSFLNGKDKAAVRGGLNRPNKGEQKLGAEYEAKFKEFQTRERDIDLRLRGSTKSPVRKPGSFFKEAGALLQRVQQSQLPTKEKNKFSIPEPGFSLSESPQGISNTANPARATSSQNEKKPEQNAPTNNLRLPPQEKPSDTPATPTVNEENRTPSLPKDPSVPNSTPTTNARLRKAELAPVIAEANLALDAALMPVVLSVWASVVPTFGFSLILGAIVGDFLWIFKGSIVRAILAPLLRTPELVAQREAIASRIKLSSKVKMNIVAMNAAILLLVLGFLFFFLMIMYAACNNSFSLPLRMTSGFGDVCKYINQAPGISSLNNRINSITGGGAIFQGPISTAEVQEKIKSASARNGIPACVLTVIVQKESGGRATAVGHDSHLSSSDPFNPAAPPFYGLDWNYPHGIGITQWTIFPDRAGWRDTSTPSRNVFGQWYTPLDFMDPDTSLGLTARRMGEHIPLYGIRETFRRYNGSGPRAESYADAAMSLYNQCVAQGL